MLSLVGIFIAAIGLLRSHAENGLEGTHEARFPSGIWCQPVPDSDRHLSRIIYELTFDDPQPDASILHLCDPRIRIGFTHPLFTRHVI